MPSNDTSANDDKTPDIISSLLSGTQFKLKAENEKLEILEKGRPLPKLNIIKRDTNGNCNRTFQSSWYDIHNWLCGSKTNNKLFCWPCLLMRPESSSWSSTGIDDMKRFSSMASKHAICKSHLKAISEYDSTLLSYNLPQEFVDDSNFKCKEEEVETIQTDSDEDLFNTYFKTETPTTGFQNSVAKSPEETAHKSEPEPSKSKPIITFKNWQEMNKDSFPMSRSRYIENLKLYKWKKKIAKQELKNSRLTGEKLKYEVQVLKAKEEYYKLLMEEISKGRNTSKITNIEVEEKEESLHNSEG